MKSLKQLSAVILLALIVSASAYAGDMQGPSAPVPGDIGGPVSAPAPGDIGGPVSAAVPGDIGGPVSATNAEGIYNPTLAMAIETILGALALY